MALFQDSTTINGIEISNMTNDALSQSAVNAIAKEANAESVGVSCTFSGSDTDGDFSQFDVYANGDYLFSVDNEGVIYSK